MVTLPDTATQQGTSYKANIDATVSAHNRLAGAYHPHEQSTPDMTVRVDAGVIPTIAGIPTEIAAQNTATITAPSSNPRKDIVHIDAVTGTVGVATGAEAASPSDPTVPAGEIPICRVNLTVGQTEIVDADIDDLRYLTLTGLAAALASTGLQQTNGQLALDFNGLGALTAPAVGDLLSLADITDSNIIKKITLQNMLKVLNSLTEDSSPDTAADYLLSYDADAAAVKKVLMSNVGGATKELFIYAAAKYDGTATGKFPYATTHSADFANQHALVTGESTDEMAFNFFIPNDFTSLTTAVVVFIANNTGTAQWDIETDFAAADETFNTHTDSVANATKAVTSGQIEELDVSAGLTGIAAGDYVGMRFDSDFNNINTIGLRIRYT